MKKGFIVGAITLVTLGLGYSAGIGYYAEKFQANTSFGVVDISNLTLEEAQAKISEDLSKERITIKENGQELGSFTFADLNGQVNTEAVLEAAYNSQDPTQWITGFFSSVEYDNLLMNNVQIADSDLTNALESIGLNNEERTESVNASVQYSDARGYYVEEEQQGNRLDLNQVKQMIVEGLQTGQETVEINTAYVKPEITSEDEKITSTMAQIEKFTNTKIVLEISGEEVTIPKEEILKWLYFDNNNQMIVDQELVKEYVGTLNEKYATYNKSREFASTLQGTVTVPAGTLGWSIDRDSEAEQIATDLAAGQDVKRSPSIVGTGYNSGGDDIGNTYVEVDIANQMMYLYIDGEQVLSTPVVTGRSGSADTVPGAYSIWDKEENATLKGYNVHTQKDYEQPVAYWIPFDDTGQGIHDASWQPVFGGEAYLSSGSLGCVNTPTDAMAQLFSIVEVGTPVIVF